MRSPSHYLIPDLMCDTVHSIPFSDFLEKGIRIAVFDIDNTLVPYDVPIPDEKVRSLLLSVKKMGFQVALVSNNSPERVERFNETLGFFAVPDSHKPLKRALRPVLEHFGVSAKEVLLVGDQLLTDVLTARICGASTVAVSPIKKVENRFFRFKRWIEKPFIRAYYKKWGKKK